MFGNLGTNSEFNFVYNRKCFCIRTIWDADYTAVEDALSTIFNSNQIGFCRQILGPWKIQLLIVRICSVVGVKALNGAVCGDKKMATLTD